MHGSSDGGERIISGVGLETTPSVPAGGRRSPIPRPELVLVDFDDTLVDTAPRFQSARRRFFRRLQDAGFPYEEILRVHNEEIDPGMIRRHGLGPFRLESAFRETYLYLCNQFSSEHDPRLADECAMIGKAVIGAPPTLDGALEALARLDAELPTIIYTQSGHPDYQFSCVEASGVLDIIPADRVHIAGHKDAAAYRQVLEIFDVVDPRTTWMIGNSMRSDINPALSNGANAILVETQDPWEYDDVPPLSTAYLTARSFVHAVEYLLTEME